MGGVDVETPQEGGDCGLVVEGGGGLWDGFGGGWEGTPGWCRTHQSQLTLFSSKDIENKRGELGGVPKWEELLVDLLEACCVQLPTGAVLDEALYLEVEARREDR